MLVIGNELLSGKTAEANVLELARLLRSLGIQLQRVVVVLDHVTTIAQELATLAASYDLVVTSGGVGPTHDDVTMAAVAAAFAVPIVTHPGMEAMLRDHYGPRLQEGHLRMALVPEGAELRTSADVRWPVTVMRNVWIFPGVPEIFRSKLPILAAAWGVDEPYLSRVVCTNLDEGTLRPWLDAIVQNFPTVEIGSYPTWSDRSYRTKLTFDGKDLAQVEAARDAFVQLLPPGEPQLGDGGERVTNDGVS